MDQAIGPEVAEQGVPGSGATWRVPHRATGYHTAMPDQPDSTPHIPSSDDADTDVQSTPAGLADELEREAEERGAKVAPEAGHTDDPDD